MSPVWAPFSAAWQVWPPVARPSIFDILASSVAGGQRSATIPSGAAAPIARASSMSARVPFIFQLPAAILAGMGVLPGDREGLERFAPPGNRHRTNPRLRTDQDGTLSASSNLIDSPQPQASTTLGLRNLKPDSSSEVS